MAKMTLNRTFIMRTLKGHSVRFVKDQQVFVPALVVSDALAIGATLDEEGGEGEGEGEGGIGGGEGEASPKAPGSPAERDPLILAAIKHLVDENNRKDFTAAGSPTVRAVERELGFDVDAREIAKNWQAYHDETAASE